MKWIVVCAVACSGSPAPIAKVAPPADAATDTPPDAPTDAPTDAAIDALDPSLLARGAALFEAKGCTACHSLDGTLRIGPSLIGDWGATVTLDDGTTVLVDEAYVRESILDSLVKKRAGFPPVMPAFADRIAPDELDALVVFIRSLR